MSDCFAQDTREYAALVFRADRARWHSFAQFVRSNVSPPPQQLIDRAIAARPGSGPSAAVRREALPLGPGDDYGVAVDDIALDEVSAPSVLERLIPSATRVILTEGASMEVLLRRVTLSEVR